MASSPTPTADLTRHQLDELDALLQRMLNLPLAAPPAMPSLPTSPPAGLVELPANWRADAAVPHVAPEPTPESDSDDSGVLPSAGLFGTPAASPTVEVEPARTLRGVDAPATPAGFAPVAFPDAEVPVPLVSVMPPAEPTVPLLAWPIAAANAGIEAGLGWLGPVGAAATSPRVKHLLGVAGVVMIAAAGWWAARGAGMLR